MSDMTLSIRQATEDDAEAIARVQAKTWESTYGDLLPPSAISAQFHPRSVGNWRRILRGPQGRLVLVADADDDIIGFVSGGTSRDPKAGFNAEIYALYVLEVWQGWGIGRALFEACRNQLMADGHDKLMLWVLVGNLAAGFYERLGGLTIAERDDLVGGAKVRERAYGWWLG
ncbi:MAG: GNAT family N-acetyltransferase [Alphaproteobacteria bacterium]